MGNWGGDVVLVWNMARIWFFFFLGSRFLSVDIRSIVVHTLAMGTYEAGEILLGGFA
jgi:hypothetical protein